MSLRALAELERRRLEFGPEAAARRLELLRRLARARLASARAVSRFHEVLCFIRAYPDDAAVLAQAETMLQGFQRRADLRAHRAALANTGIAGTAIHYRFFAGQAHWLAGSWPRQLKLDRSDEEAEARIAHALPTLLTHAEACALRELKEPAYRSLDRLRSPEETDAVFLLRNAAAMPGSGFTREAFVDAMDASFVLAPGPGTPSRTLERFDAAAVVLRSEAPPRARPDLRQQLARAPRSVKRLTGRRAQSLVDLARGAMVVRERSLEAFSFADARDVWLVDDGDGLAFSFAGVIPERRHAIASYYGGLTLRNGVPIGYWQADMLGAGAALSFNTFETFRGTEAAHIFVRWLAALRHLFGATSFSIEPYQLGKGNEEGLESGAWWFYAKLGFRPRDPAALALASAELQKAALQSRHRTAPATLRRLAGHHVFFDVDLSRPRPFVSLAELGMRCGRALSARGAVDRTRAVDDASDALMRLCALDSLRSFSTAQREAWRRLAAVLAMLDVRRWSAEERRALVEVIRAKGGRSEREYVVRYRAHPRLDAAILGWAREQGA
jgi:hypothetical protein